MDQGITIYAIAEDIAARKKHYYPAFSRFLGHKYLIYLMNMIGFGSRDPLPMRISRCSNYYLLSYNTILDGFP